MPKILTGRVRCTSVTDDKQTTDGRATAYSEREREFAFAKNDGTEIYHWRVALGSFCV